MAKTIKSILMEANRYDDVMSIIRDIIVDNQRSYPVNAFVKNNEIKWHVDGAHVRSEAHRLLYLICEDKCIGSDDDFVNLSSYVESRTDMFLHNYAISISHRNEPDVDMEYTRCWEILDNLLRCWNIKDDEFEWDIPDGWKKINTLGSENIEAVQMNIFDTDKLISTFEDMANRGTLLTGANVTQEDLLMQIIGTIVKVSREDK